MDATIQRAAYPALTHRPHMGPPALSRGIPLKLSVPGESRIATPMAIAMIKHGMITDYDFRPKDGTLLELFKMPDEKRLVQNALTNWWRRKTAPITLFQWNLHAEILNGYHNRSDDPTFVVSAGDIPQRTLARAIGELERELPGFGQTVLAVLYDALDYLPISWSPASIFGMAQFVYWSGEINEVEFAKVHAEEYGDAASAEEFLKDNDVFKRAAFFRHMPEWVALPQRVCSRKQLKRAASSPLGKNVIAACDVIHAVVTAPGFSLNPRNVGVNFNNYDSIEASIFLRWNEEDACGRVIDDAIEFFWQGEYIEAIHLQPVTTTAQGIAKALVDIEQILAMAEAVQRLLLLISDPAREAR